MPAIRTPSVPALERGLAILELVAGSRNGMTFSQIANHVGFPKSSVHCLLLTFEREGYLRRSETSGRYVCGLKLLQLANSASHGLIVREKAMPELRFLAERTQLTAHMAILENTVATMIAKVEPLGPRRISTWVGKRIDIHCTSLGKCLVAWLAQLDLEKLVREQGLLRHNENTIATISRLRQELDRVRKQGWAIDDEEEEIGVRCVGVSIPSGIEGHFAAISLSGSLDDLPAERCSTLVSQLRQTAERISEQGGSGALQSATAGN